MDLDRYVARESWLHAADARLKFLLAIAFILAVGLVPVGGFAAIAAAWLMLVTVAWTARLGALRTVRGAFIAIPFALATLPLVLTEGPPYLAVLTVGPLELALSEEGTVRFLTIMAKSWVSVQAALLLAYTTPFHDLVDGLRALRLPRIMVAIIGFMYRYLGVIGDEAVRLNRARAARSAVRADVQAAARPGGRLRWRARVTGAMVGSLFLRSYERSERIYAAMQARGFDGELRVMAGPAIPPGAIVWFGVGLAILILFEIVAQGWLL